MIIGLDPSFKGFGYCEIDFVNKIVKTRKFDVEFKKLSFDEICFGVDKLVDSLMKELRGRTIRGLITETPPPTARFSAGLYALDYAITREVLNKKECPIYGVSCSYIGHLHHNKKWKKSESVLLARDIVNNVLESSGFDCTEVQFESNQCEALLIAMRLCYKQGNFVRLLDEVTKKYRDELEFKLY